MNHLSLQQLRLSGWLMLLVCLAGCGQSKESLHEMDHVTPEHWPVSLKDAAVKVRERLATLQSSVGAEQNRTAFEEISDLVGWVPEVAADTDLAEAEWNKLYAASEVARKELLRTQSITPELAKNIEALCELLTAAHELLPQPAPETQPEAKTETLSEAQSDTQAGAQPVPSSESVDTAPNAENH